MTFRRFVRGDPALVGAIASRLAGSADIYQERGGSPVNSVNFVTCHDGFTLNDLVSFNQKHNEANGQNNSDGADNNLSWNCGAEGDSDDPNINSLRNRQVRNFMAILLLSRGVPMFGAGDEIFRSQRGNNNAYCQDNETSWLDWGLLAKHADVHRFVRLLNAHRLAFEASPQRLNLSQLLRVGNRVWHGVKLGQPDWSATSHSLALQVESRDEHVLLYVILNAYWEWLEFELPSAPHQTGWHRWIDTSLDSPGDVSEWLCAPRVADSVYRTGPRSVVVLYARLA